MDGWIDGLIDGWIDELMDEWMGGWIPGSWMDFYTPKYPLYIRTRYVYNLIHIPDPDIRIPCSRLLPEVERVDRINVIWERARSSLNH